MDKELKSMTEAVRLTIANYPAGHRFHGNELHNDVVAIYPEAKNMYTDTLMRMMRRFCKGQYVTVDHNNSLYEKIGVKPIEQIKEPETITETSCIKTPTPEVQMELFPIYNWIN